MKNITLFIFLIFGLVGMCGCLGIGTSSKEGCVDVYIVSHEQWKYFQFSTRELNGDAIRTGKINGLNIWRTDLSHIDKFKVDSSVINSHEQEQVFSWYDLKNKSLMATVYFDESPDDIILKYLNGQSRGGKN